MDGITYTVHQHYGKCQVCMHDPVFGHPWYLKSVCKGQYEWTGSDLFGKHVSLRTALMHIRNLESGADKGWTWYHNHWKNYFDSIRSKKEE